MSFNRFKDLPFYLTHVARSVLNTLVNEYVMDGDKSFLEEMNKRETTADYPKPKKKFYKKAEKPRGKA